jgi:hypothetical protein
LSMFLFLSFGRSKRQIEDNIPDFYEPVINKMIYKHVQNLYHIKDQ